MEEATCEGQKKPHVDGAAGWEVGAFEENGGARDIGGRLTARGGGPINNHRAAAGEKDVRGMHVTVAENFAVGELREGRFGGAAVRRSKVAGVGEPAFEL